ncbi:MAG TPA: peptidoglycan DD-metalloendopeptidase family protein [Actinomycetaceae bacterium]|nr:peptidoglycan DD-metalloendopeptidase family protein [Actinomycetaceae bacterium]
MTPTARRHMAGLAAAVGFTIGVALTPAAHADGAAPKDWSWPTGEPAAVVRAYAPPEVPWGSGHRGVDLELQVGAPVLAAGDGVAVFAGNLAGRGVVSIEHASGLRTTYEPVESVISAGDHVSRGEIIGYLEAGHCAQGCLHFGLKAGSDLYRDPLSLFERTRVRLLPLGGLAAAVV